MTLLRTCPRCTQALPASAGFCRRCGLAVATRAADAGSVAPPAAIPARWPTVGGASLVVAVVAVGAVGLLWRGPVRPSISPVMTSPSVVVTPAPVYTLPVPPAYPPSVTIAPGYPTVPYRPYVPREPRPSHRR